MKVYLFFTFTFLVIQTTLLAQELDSTEYFEDSIDYSKWRYGIQLSGYKNIPNSKINSFYSTSYAFEHTSNEIDGLETGVGKSAAYIFYFDVGKRFVTSIGLGFYGANYTILGHKNDSVVLPPDYNYSKITQKIKYNALSIPLDFQYYWKKGKVAIFNTFGYQYSLAYFNNNTIETQETENSGTITYESEFVTQKLPSQNVSLSAGIELFFSDRYQLRIEPFYFFSIDNNVDIKTTGNGLKVTILAR